MLIGIYLGTTLYVWYDMIKHFKEMDKKLKEEGYEFLNKKHYFSDIPFVIFCIAALSIPVINLIFPLVNSNKDRSYDEYKNYLLEAGAIEKDEPYEKPMVTANNNQTITGDKIVYIQKLKNIEELDKRINMQENLDNETGYSYQKVYKRK